jgi:hypothetical protein
MTSPLRGLFLTFLLGGIMALISCRSILADTITPAENNPIAAQSATDFFVPLDSLPDFYDVHQVAFQYITGFDRLQASFSNAAFYDIPGVTGEALSDHLTTWREFAQCLNSAGTLYSSSAPNVTAHHLWTSQMQPYITRSVVSRQIVGSPFFVQVFSYDVMPEHGNEAAILSAATAQRYVNWRNVHYWLYDQLQREEAILNQQPIITGPDDKITAYFRKKNLYPPIDLINSIDHIDAILAQSTEVGCYWFSDNGDTVQSINLKAAFSLPTTAQKKSWDIGYAEQFPLQGTTWLAESVANNASAATAALQLAVNKDLMMQGKDAAAKESALQQKVYGIQHGFALLKSSDTYQQANASEQAELEGAFFNGIGIFSLFIGVGDLVAMFRGVLELRFALLESLQYGPVMSMITKGTFSLQDCSAANEILSTYEEGNSALSAQQIHMIISKQIPRSMVTTSASDGSMAAESSVVPGLSDRQYQALAQVYKNKLNSQWKFGISEVIISAFCFYFGISSNIDCNY